LQRGTHAALLPAEKAFLPSRQGCGSSPTLSISIAIAPLATTRRYLDENRELVGKVARIYRDSVQLFNSTRN
jgi:hypothetical protein